MRQRAWHSTSIQVTKEITRTRAELLEERGEKIIYPDLEEGSNLISWISELGFCMPGAMGAIALSWSEIASWASLTGTDVLPSESLLLRRLSNEYCHQLRQKDEDEPAPYSRELTEDEAKEVQAKIRRQRQIRRGMN